MRLDVFAGRNGPFWDGVFFRNFLKVGKEPLVVRSDDVICQRGFLREIGLYQFDRLIVDYLSITILTVYVGVNLLTLDEAHLRCNAEIRHS
jgi:hypothetical protein